MKNIVENNKLIAKFMGFVADKSFEVKLVDGINTSYYYYKDDVMYLPEVMAYHSDWSWLMEVVEAIEKLGCKFNIYHEDCLIEKNKKFIVVTHAIKNKTKKEAVVHAINQFLIFYNENNNNRQSR